MIAPAEVSEDVPASRQRILDAAQQCLRAKGIRLTTMAEVAHTAEVSRAWLYRLYPDKATLVSAALIQRDEEFWAQAHRRVRRKRTVAAKVAEAIAISRADQWGPIALELRDREPDQFAAVVGEYVHDVVPGMVTFWHEHLAEAKAAGQVRADLDIPSAAEWVLRVVMSLVAVPGLAVDIDDTRSVTRYLETYLIPALT